VIQHRGPDTVVVEKDNMALSIDIAVPADTIVEQEQERVDKYENLPRELKRLWKVNTNMIPIVVGAQETTPKA